MRASWIKWFRESRGDDGSEGDRPVFGTMADEHQGFATPYGSGAHPPGAGALAGNLVAGPGLDGSSRGGGAGAGPTYYQTLGIGFWLGRAADPDIRADRGFPPAVDQAQQAELKVAMQELPAAAGNNLANWNWKVVRQFVSERFSIVLSRSSCLNWLHRLGSASKRPKKRLVKEDEVKRKSFVAEYADLREEVRRIGRKIFFADEAHFRADAELRGKRKLKGEPVLVDSTSPCRARGPAITRRCAWRRARRNGWNWRGTAMPGHLRPSWPSCAAVRRNRRT